ncbi:hypothetical protein ABZ383_22580 [Streptomyces sp. NPDC005900]|uniref:type II toxin-antitoxin system RelE family toxin n=1 Tax=Streptomyces sp. NPDC005900 TaxID=3154569 RepID=UPI0033E2ADCB
MSTWRVVVPPRLYEEFAHLTGPGRKAVHDLLDQLAADPRHGSSREPIEGAELRQISTAPTRDTGDRIALLYRVHNPPPGEAGTVEVIWIMSGP